MHKSDIKVQLTLVAHPLQTSKLEIMHMYLLSFSGLLVLPGNFLNDIWDHLRSLLDLAQCHIR